MLQSIIDSFTGLSTMMWISQICGIIGLILIAISYQFGKKKFLLISTFSFIFFILEQAFANVYANLITSVLSFVRNLLMFIFLFKYNKELPRWLIYLLLGSMWVAEIIYMAITHTFNVWDNYLPPTLASILTFFQNSKNPILLKIGVLIHESGCLVYYFINNMPFSMLRQLLLVICALVGLIIIIINLKKNNQENVVKQDE